jgi:hypothetical protein
MANRTFLIQSSTAAPFEYDESSPDVLAAANNCIPVYWYSLFDTSSLAENSVPMQDGSRMSYPCLVTSTSEAQGRCRGRKPLLEQLTPPSHTPVLDAWLRFVEAIEMPYLHVNTAEFCMMADGCGDHLQTCLEAFETPMAAEAAFSASPAWVEMLDVAQIDPDDLAATVAGYKLAGYQWARPVPWDFNM